MPPNAYTPGKKLGALSPNAVLWLQANRHVFELFENETMPDEDQDNPVGHRIAFMQAGRRGNSSIFLSALTTAELQAIREFFNRAFDMAEPVCREMDRRAQEAQERGDGVYARSYRAVPLLVVRESKQPPHYSSLPFGPDGVLEVEPGDELEFRRRWSGKRREDVPEPESGELVPEDNEAEGERP